MKLFEWLKGKFSRDKPQNSYRFSDFPFFFGRSISGKNINEFAAMQNTAVYACVRTIAESIAALPLHVYEYKNGGKEKAINHPLYSLLHDAPNDEMTSFIYRENLITHLLLRGNCYSQILRNFGRRGEVRGLYPLQPDKMSIERDDDGRLFYKYRRFDEKNPNFKDKGEIILRQDEVLHVAGLGFDGIIGYSPIAMAKNAIGLSIACEDFGSNFFANGARPSGILKTPTLIKNPEKLRESWQSMYGGANAGKVAILEEGMSYESISIPPEDAQFLQTRKFQIAEIARIFRVPLHFLNELDHATFSNIEEQSREFVIYTLTPWIARLEQAFNKSLLTPDEKKKYFIKFNLSGLLRGNYASRMQGYAVGRQNGWLSANDIRELEDMNLISAEEGGNAYLINGNMTKLSDAGAAYQKQKAGDTNEK